MCNQKNKRICNEELNINHPTKMPENCKNGFKKECQPSKNSSHLPTPIKKTETTTNKNENSTQYSVENLTAVKNCPVNSDTSKNNMTTIKRIRPVNRSHRQRQQNGEKLLKESIEKAVRNFSWDSGYVHDYYSSFIIPYGGYRPHARPPFCLDYNPYHTNYSPPNIYNLNRFSHPFKKDHPQCPSARQPYYPVTNRRVTGCSNSLTEKLISRASFDKTHWFRDEFKKAQIYALTQRVHFTTKKISIMPPIAQNSTLKANSENCRALEIAQETTETTILPPDTVAATPDDLAVNTYHVCDLPQDQNEDDSLESEPVTYDCDVSFSDMDCYSSSSEDENSDEEDNIDVSHRQPDSDHSHSICDDDEEDDQNGDELEVDGLADTEDDLEIDGHVDDSGASFTASWSVRPDSDTNDEDGDDDWDCRWSSCQASPHVPDEIDELFCCTPIFSCAKETDDVSAVDNVDGGNFQSLKQANEKWKKVYGDVDFTFQEENPSKKVFILFMGHPSSFLFI